MTLTSSEKKETNIVELEVAVDAGTLEEACTRVYKRSAKNITVPGFRKGKAPRKMIENLYGEGVFMEDAVNDLLPQAYGEAVDEAKIEPVDQPKIEMLNLDKATGFTFKATVTVKPEVTVKDYKGIEAEKGDAAVTDDEVEGELTRMQDRNARIITIEDRAAQNDDTTVIDFEGFVDGVPFEGGKGEDYSLVLGSHSFIDTFEEQIVGHKTGESFDVNVTFPEEYHAENLKGKPALFKVTLKEIKGKELPELDDEFAKDVSEFDTLEELKADIRKKLVEAKEKRVDEEFENALVDKVIEGLEGEIPECMYENRTDELVREFEQRLQSQGMQVDLYLQYTGMDMESFRKTFREQAEKQVKIRLALEKIAEVEKLDATAEDIEAEYAKLAENYKMEADKIKALLPEQDIARDITSGKAIDLIRDSAKVGTPKKAAAKKAPAKKAAAKKADGGEKVPAKKPAAKKTTKAAKTEDAE